MVRYCNSLPRRPDDRRARTAGAAIARAWSRGGGGGRTSAITAMGTVREDYSSDGEAWDYLPHAHARSRAYRWGEDGLAGVCDTKQRLCIPPRPLERP